MSDALGGRPLGRGLFKEYAADYPDDVEQPYSLEEFHTVFLEEEDMTEYKPAIRLVGDWATWEKLKSNFPTLTKFIKEWKDELEIKLRSKAVEKVLGLLDSEAASVRLSAAKYIAEAGWKKSGRGRPSKAEVARKADEIARKAAETKEEWERVGQVIEWPVRAEDAN